MKWQPLLLFGRVNDFVVGPLLSLVTRPHRGRAPCPPQVSARQGPGGKHMAHAKLAV